MSVKPQTTTTTNYTKPKVKFYQPQIRLLYDVPIIFTRSNQKYRTVLIALQIKLLIATKKRVLSPTGLSPNT